MIASNFDIAIFCKKFVDFFSATFLYQLKIYLAH